MIPRNQIWSWVNDNPVKVIFLAGIFMRLLVAALYQHITLYPDSEDYIYLAEWLSDFNLSGYEGQRSPGYPLLILLAGFSDVVVVILQALAGIGTLIVSYKTMSLLGMRKEAALTTTLLLSLYLPAVFFEFAILTETVTLFVISLVFYFYFRQYKKDETSSINLLMVTLLCAYLVLIKPFYIFLPILLIAFFLINNKPLNGLWKGCAIVLLIPSFVFLGWSYTNKENTGYFVSSTFYGFNLAQTCVSFAEKTTPEYQEIGEIYAKYRDNRISDKEEAMVIWEAYPELQEKTGLSFPDLSKKLYDYSIATIKENPAAYLKQTFVSWCDFWKTSLYWEQQNFGVSGASDAIQYICYLERILLQLIKILFVILIPINIACSVRRKEISPQLMISVIVLMASILQALSTYGTNSRYSFPFEMLIVISVTLNYLQYRARKKKTA